MGRNPYNQANRIARIHHELHETMEHLMKHDMAGKEELRWACVWIDLAYKELIKSKDED